ncbi:MAG: hypothetical protein B7Z22_09295 [Hyphomonas sp. 32-62-5]|nr:MAG: hypothetical protein B7Z22_09295 [Hyphomonas sp. 32-62-5]
MQKGNFFRCKYARLTVDQAEGTEAFAVRVTQWSAREKDYIRRARDGGFASKVRLKPGIGNRERFIGEIGGSTECLKTIKQIV